jgi:ligand-binding sensor domain-containing protein/signal transduction histidine kinase
MAKILCKKKPELSLRSLNFCHKICVKRHKSLLCLLAGCFTLLTAGNIYALDPNRVFSQFSHDRWTAAANFSGGTIYAIAQTADGYLWLGTEKGLVRFDGLNFKLFQNSNTRTLPAGPVLGLLTDTDGNLWIRLQSPSIIRYRNGKFENILNNLERVEPRITAMNLGKNKEILLSTFENGILKYEGEKFVTLATKADITHSIVVSIAETLTGDIWLGTRDTGLIRLSEQKFSNITKNLPDQKINCLLPLGNNELLIGTDKGIVRWNGNQLSKFGVPMLEQVQILTMLKDRDSNIWIGTDRLGLVRFNPNGQILTNQNNDKNNVAITALFEDREGNLWAGSDQGLERFCESAFVTYSTNEGLPAEKNGAVVVDSANQMWFAPLAGGLYRLNKNQVEKIAVEGLADDIVYSISGGEHSDLWIGRQRGGLTHIHFDGAKLTAQTYTQKDGLAQNSVYAVYQSRDRSVWAGTLSGGVSRFKNGEFTNYTDANGLTSNAVMAIAESADGATMFFATPNGLNILSNEIWQTLSVRDGLPSENIISLLTDSAGGLWIGTANGLAYLDGAGQIRNLAKNSANLGESIMGLAADQKGSLWMATANHVLRVNREKLLNNVVNDETVREYEILDGLKSVEGVKRNQSVIADATGRVWFSLNRGISMVDTNRLSTDSVPALVQIETISVDGKTVEVNENLHLSSTLQRLTVNYAGLSLAIPERVKFRYLLEGFDKDWSEPTPAREAVYTNLSPGIYNFRVIASNSDGVWHSPEATVRFEIEPMFWQTKWFRLLSVIMIVCVVIALYRLRLHRITNRLNARFEERLAERTHIAQELHDSLLQGIVSVSLQLNVAVDNVPTDSPSKRHFNRILELMGQVTKEGRNTLRGLRASKNNEVGNLEKSFAEIRQDFQTSEQADFRVIVEGLPRPLRTIARDEAYHIGREALLNAYRHSQAKKIEVVVEYAAKHLRVIVRDDGRGIDEYILNSGDCWVCANGQKKSARN